MLSGVMFIAAIIVVFKVADIEDRSPVVWLAALLSIYFLLMALNIPLMYTGLSIGLSMVIVLIAMTVLKLIRH